MPDIDSDFFSSGYIFFRPDVNAFVPVALQTQYGSGKERCSALVHNHATFSGPSGTLYSKEIFLNRLLVGRNYISDPSTAFVKEIFFTPLPNKQLFMRGMFDAIMPGKDITKIEFASSCTHSAKKFADANLAYFKAERGTIFETSIASVKATFSAAIWGINS